MAHASTPFALLSTGIAPVRTPPPRALPRTRKICILLTNAADRPTAAQSLPEPSSLVWQSPFALPREQRVNCILSRSERRVWAALAFVPA